VNDPVRSTAESRRHLKVSALRRALDASNPGTLAALRRTDPAAPPAAFYRITVDALDEDAPEAGRSRDALETQWAVVVAAMASAQGLLGDVPLGLALARAGVTEMRVLRLLEARGPALADLVRGVVHQMVQRAERFDPNDLADLVLTNGTAGARAPRRRIARSFYRHQAD
jgi:CRISPR system Cascade subunit CasB